MALSLVVVISFVLALQAQEQHWNMHKRKSFNDRALLCVNDYTSIQNIVNRFVERSVAPAVSLCSDNIEAIIKP